MVTRDETSLAGTTVCITGANAGIGHRTALGLAARGARIIMVNRSAERSAPVLAEIDRLPGDGVLVEGDLSDLASVRDAASAIDALDEPIHVLVNNAGIAGLRGATAQGFELAFGVNHLAHFLLTDLLIERLRASATPSRPSRVVCVSSRSHYSAKTIDFDALRTPTDTVTGLPEYAVSKLANVLFAQELARREDPAVLTTYALHPGVIASNIWKRIPWPVRPLVTRFMKSTEEGAATSLHCATAPELTTHTGRYYDDCRERTPSAVATPELAGRLWEQSVAWTSPDESNRS